MTVRWMLRGDLDSVMEIQNMVMMQPWTEDETRIALKSHNTIGRVIDVDDVVCGYSIYTLAKKKVEVLNFAIHPESWRCGYGEMMIDHIKSRLSTDAVTQLLQELHALGIVVAVRGDDLRLHPTSKVSGDLKNRVRKEKQEILLRMRADSKGKADLTKSLIGRSRTRIIFELAECNLRGLQFLKAQEFAAVSMHWDEQLQMDRILMVYDVNKSRFHPRNRISGTEMLRPDG